MEKIETKVVKPEITLFENDVNHLIINPSEESNLDARAKDVEDFMKNNFCF